MNRKEFEDKRTGAMLKALRIRHNIKSEEIANQLGISNILLSNIEAGRRSLTEERVGCAAKILNVDPIVFTSSESLPVSYEVEQVGTQKTFKGGGVGGSQSF